MARVDSLTTLKISGTARHTTVQATCSLVLEDDGTKCLQIDTYGSANRQEVGKKSQSIRLTPTALRQLVKLAEQYRLLDSTK